MVFVQWDITVHKVPSHQLDALTDLIRTNLAKLIVNRVQLVIIVRIMPRRILTLNVPWVCDNGFLN